MKEEICPSCGSEATFTMLEGERGLWVAQLYRCDVCGDTVTRCTVCGKPMVWGLQCLRCTGEAVGSIVRIGFSVLWSGKRRF